MGLLALLRSKGVGGPFLLVSGSNSLDVWSHQLHRMLGPDGLLLHVYNANTRSREMLNLLCSTHGA